MGGESAQRPQRRLRQRGGEIDHRAGGLPFAGSAAHAEARRELSVRSCLRARVVGCGQRLSDRRFHGLELVDAPVGQQSVLDVAQARQVARVLFEDRPVPQQRARGVVAPGGVQVGKALVGFAAGALILGRPRGGEQRVGEMCGSARSELRPFEHQRGNTLAGQGLCSGCVAERCTGIARALELVGCFEVETYLRHR